MKNDKTIITQPNEIFEKGNNFFKKIGSVRPFIVFIFTVLFLIISISLLAPVIFPVDLATTDLSSRLIMPSFIESSSNHLLGTDQLGRDVLTRVFYATRSTILISFTGMTFAALLGSTLGVIAGLRGGRADNFISFLTDAMLSVPTTFIGILGAVILGATPITTILVITFSGWASFCRIVRGQTLQIRNSEYIEVSRTLSASKFRIVFEHVIPNIASPLIVHATSALSGFILLESTLSFLGLGIQPPGTSLGIMVSEGRDFMLTHWWLAITPSLVIIILILAISLLGDWLRDKLDPKLKNK